MLLHLPHLTQYSGLIKNIRKTINLNDMVWTLGSEGVIRIFNLIFILILRPHER